MLKIFSSNFVGGNGTKSPSPENLKDLSLSREDYPLLPLFNPIRLIHKAIKESFHRLSLKRIGSL